jgi:protoporphyrinogen/coproporphyrinogen III oxidase
MRNPMKGTYEVVVVGGGISGLATCYFTQKRAKDFGSKIHITLIEEGSRLGGKVFTDRIDGFTIEAGPDSFFTQKPWALDLCRELGLTDRLEEPDPAAKGTYILNNGRLSKLPQGAETGMPTKIMPFLRSDLLSPIGKLRALMDLVIPRRKETGDESVGDFIGRRFGREFLEKIVEPLFAGIFAGDAKQLSIKAVAPRLIDLESANGSLIRSMLRLRNKERPSKNVALQAPPSFLTLRDGLVEIIDGLASHLGDSTVLLNNRVITLTSNEEGFLVTLENGRSLSADVAILATPAYVSARLVHDISKEAEDLLESIPYSSTATVSMAFKKEELDKKLEGYGFLVPRTENEMVTGCTWSSSKWPENAPHGFVLLRCYVGWAGHEEFLQLNDVSLIDSVRGFLTRVVGISAEPVLVKAYRWNRALPQYTVGHLERVSMLMKTLGNAGSLFVTGSAYRGVGLPDCIHEGALTAEQVVRAVAKRESKH